MNQKWLSFSPLQLRLNGQNVRPSIFSKFKNWAKLEHWPLNFLYRLIQWWRIKIWCWIFIFFCYFSHFQQFSQKNQSKFKIELLPSKFAPRLIWGWGIWIWCWISIFFIISVIFCHFSHLAKKSTKIQNWALNFKIFTYTNLRMGISKIEL